MSFGHWLLISVSSLALILSVVKIVRDARWNHRLDQFQNVHQLKVPGNHPKMAKASPWLPSFGLLGVTATLVFSTVSGLWTPNNHVTDPDSNRQIVNALRVNSKDKLMELVQDVYQYNAIRNGGIFPTAMEDAAMSSSQTNTTATSNKADFIDTNTQVEGVAEGDIIKTNGNTIFYAPRYQNVIRVLDVQSDKQLKIRTTIDLADLYVDALYITPTQLVVIGYTYERYSPASRCGGDADIVCDAMYWWGSPKGTVEVFNLLTLESEFKLVTDGFFQEHRLLQEVDANNPDVTHRSLFLISNKTFWNEEDPRPELTTTVDGETTSDVVDYDKIFYFNQTPAYSMTVFHGLSLDEYTVDAQAFLGNVSQLYVNQQAVYTVDVMYTYSETDGNQQTLQVVKYDLDIPTGKVSYVGQAKLEGYTLNQFSMDEYEGYFRIATTETNWNWMSGTNAVRNRLYVLKESATTDELEIVGTLGEDPNQLIGKPGESIKAVRFLGTKAYIVTFLTKDPLYEIDLSDPTNPRLTGVEKVEEGYSTYIHQWDDNHLLGLGYAADENGRTIGMKISVYAVGDDEKADESNPLETYYLYDRPNTNVVTYEYSEALYNHKALMISPSHGILGFAVQSWSYELTQGPNGETYYGGTTYTSEYLIFNIDFTKSPIISEPIRIQQTPEYYYNMIDRGQYIDGVVYTLSYHQMVAYDIVNNVEVQRFVFPEFVDNKEIWGGTVTSEGKPS